MREGKVCTAAPNIKADFGTNGKVPCYGTINFDSGAMVSYIHECMITNSDHVESGPRTREYFGAGGDRLKLKPFTIDINVNVDGQGVYKFKNVLVSTSEIPSRTMLVGQSDLERLGIDISFARRCVTFGVGALQGVTLPMERNVVASINPLDQAESQEDRGCLQQFHEPKFNGEGKTVGGAGTDECRTLSCCVNRSKRQKEGIRMKSKPTHRNAERISTSQNKKSGAKRRINKKLRARAEGKPDHTALITSTMDLIKRTATKIPTTNIQAESKLSTEGRKLTNNKGRGFAESRNSAKKKPSERDKVSIHIGFKKPEPYIIPSRRDLTVGEEV